MKGRNKGKQAVPRGASLCSVPGRHFFFFFLVLADVRNSATQQLACCTGSREAVAVPLRPRASRCYRNRTYVRCFHPRHSLSQIPRHAVMCCCLTLHPALLVKIEQVSGHSYLIENSLPPTTVTAAIVPRPGIEVFNFVLIPRYSYTLLEVWDWKGDVPLIIRNSQATRG